MAIRELITLEGTQQVEAQLARINVAGEASIKQFNALSGAGVGAFDPLAQGAKVATQELANVERSTISLGTQMRALRPILHGLGVDLGGIGGLARVANQSLALAAAAAGGLAVVGLAKLDENSQRAKAQLTDLFKSTEKGDQAFDALTQSSKQFGSSVASLTPGLIAFQTALNNVDKTAQGFVALREEDLPGGGTKNVKLATDAYNNFLKALRAGRETQADAEKSAKAFFDAFKDGGPITSAALKNLPVGTISLLKEALGAAGLTTKAFFEQVDAGTLTMDKFAQALVNAGPQIERAFELKAIKTFGDETQKLLATLNAGLQKLTGKGFSDFLITQLSSLNKGLQDTGSEIQKVIDLLDRLDKATEIPGLGALVTRLRGAPGAGITTGPTLEQAGKEFATTGPTLEQAGRAGEAAGEAFNQGFLKAGFKFPPTQFQDAGSDIAASLGKGFVNNKFFQQQVPQAIEEPISEAMRQALLQPITIPDEAQQALVEQFKQTGVAAGQALQQGAQQIPVDFSSWISALQQFGNAATNQAQQIYDQIKAIFAQPIEIRGQFSGFGGQTEGAPFAAGGKVRGRGTSTSDSNLAWLSVNEWVINARAVQHYGSALFSALNAMTLPRDFISRFAMGGLVRAMNSGNRLAAGGQVNTAPFTLVLPDGMRLGGMTATDETVARLRRYAVKSQLSATGRKPSWVR